MLLFLFEDCCLGIFEVLVEELMEILCIFNDDLIINVYKFLAREARKVKVDLQCHFKMAILKGINRLILELILLGRKLPHYLELDIP